MSRVLVDDRLLIEELLVGLPWPRRRPDVFTTAYWYYRACRAAVLSGGGHLSGPFLALPPSQQERAIRSLLSLPGHIGLPDARDTVPKMAEVAGRHQKLNVMTLEAVAAASVLGASVWLSPPAARGVLPGVLDAEHVAWRTLAIG